MGGRQYRHPATVEGEMKIGITQPAIAPDMVGLSNVFALLKKALAQRHMVLELPPGYDRHSKSQRRLSAEQFVLECDAILGVGKLEVLEARESLGKPVPYLFYALGHFSRGAIGIAGMLPYVTNLDTIIVNCTADEAIAQQLLQNAQVEVIPYPVDLEFYRDLGETNRERARESFGIASATPILLYPGRITLEKNVHTLIKIFGEVQRRVPTALLLLAGRIYDRPVPELGLYVINLERAISRTIERSGIPEGHVRFLGHAEASTMRDLYNIADVVVNTTLHHDENFGNAQVEALACGTPVVGTYWGGLKDSIVDDTTGYHISTYVTPIGIKVNWLEAIDNVVSILQDDRLRSRLRQSSLERAAEKYSMGEFVRRVDAAMNRTLRERQRTTWLYYLRGVYCRV